MLFRSRVFDTNGLVYYMIYLPPGLCLRIDRVLARFSRPANQGARRYGADFPRKSRVLRRRRHHPPAPRPVPPGLGCICDADEHELPEQRVAGRGGHCEPRGGKEVVERVAQMRDAEAEAWLKSGANLDRRVALRRRGPHDAMVT